MAETYIHPLVYVETFLSLAPKATHCRNVQHYDHVLGRIEQKLDLAITPGLSLRDRLLIVQGRLSADWTPWTYPIQDDVHSLDFGEALRRLSDEFVPPRDSLEHVMLVTKIMVCFAVRHLAPPPETLDFLILPDVGVLHDMVTVLLRNEEPSPYSEGTGTRPSTTHPQLHDLEQQIGTVSHTVQTLGELFRESLPGNYEGGPRRRKRARRSRLDKSRFSGREGAAVGDVVVGISPPASSSGE